MVEYQQTAAFNMSEPYQPEKRMRRSDPYEALLHIARGSLNPFARIRTVESVSFITNGVWHGDPDIAATSKAAARARTYKTPFPLHVLQFLACCEDLMELVDATNFWHVVTGIRLLKCYDKHKTLIKLYLGEDKFDAWKVDLAMLERNVLKAHLAQGQAIGNDSELAEKVRRECRRLRQLGQRFPGQDFGF